MIYLLIIPLAVIAAIAVALLNLSPFAQTISCIVIGILIGVGLGSISAHKSLH